MILFALAVLLAPCDPDALDQPSLVLEEIEYTGGTGVFRHGLLPQAVGGYWVSDHQTVPGVMCTAVCAASPCTVLIPTPGEVNVAFILEGADDMRVAG